MLELLAPAPRQESEKVVVSGLAEAATWTGKFEAVVAAVARGDISAEGGERVLRMIDAFRRATAVDDLEQRVAALEKGVAGRTLEPEKDLA